MNEPLQNESSDLNIQTLTLETKVQTVSGLVVELVAISYEKIEGYIVNAGRKTSCEWNYLGHPVDSFGVVHSNKKDYNLIRVK